MSALSRPIPVGRVGAALLALAVLGIAVELVVLPIARVFLGDPVLEEQRATIARFRQIAATEPKLKAALATPSPVGGSDAGARFAEKSDALALATLQRLVHGLADAAGVEVTTTEPLPAAPGQKPEQAANGARIALSVQLGGRLEGLQKVIHGIEAARPYLFITRCAIDRVAGQAGENADPSLVARLTIAAYRESAP